ncbi:hypothetical protein ACQ86N_18910 [Puia sp. P3]|uniref:hypothetical protein n=1 Tax=Puia sp. P3 TaxID=3423952 RepID=UPI003D67CF20
MAGEGADDVDGDIAGQQGAEVVVAGVDGVELVDCKGIRDLQYSLCPVVLVLGVDVLEIDGVAAGIDLDVDAFFAEFFDGVQLAVGERRHQCVAYVHTRECIREVEGRASGHMYGRSGCYNFIQCDMSYAADFVFVHVRFTIY